MSRYQRQIVLSEIGLEGQEKLNNASVLCIGAGGLGCPALLYLAAAGIGTLGIIDFDVVDESNLQRQILFTTGQIGTLKTIAAEKRLTALNPEINIQCHNEALGLDNIESLFNSYDIVIDGTDNFAAKFLINDAGVKFNTPVIYGAIQGFDGQVSVFDSRQGPCYRCLFPKPPETHIQNCAENGVIGAIAGIVGTTQAMQAIMLITQSSEFRPLVGKLWTIDMRSMGSQLLNIPKSKSCPTCSKKTSDIQLSYTTESCVMPAQVNEVTLNDLSPQEYIIDVREEAEWLSGHLPNARWHSLSNIQNNNFPDIPADQDIILYCQKGLRSQKAASILKKHFNNNFFSLKGGYEAYKK